MKTNIVPMLFGFLLLGGVSHATAAHHHAKGAQTTVPGQPPARLPQQLRVLADGAAGENIVPLPVYVPDHDPAYPSRERRFAWSS